VGCVTDVGDDAVTIFRNGKEDEDAVGVPENGDFAGVGGAREVQIGENPIAGQCVAGEFHF